MSDNIKVFVTAQAKHLGKDILGHLAQRGYDHFIKSNRQCSLYLPSGEPHPNFAGWDYSPVRRMGGVNACQL